jgi:DNA repair ATPase RecN
MKFAEIGERLDGVDEQLKEQRAEMRGLDRICDARSERMDELEKRIAKLELCNCDLPVGTPHVCAEERQADGPIEFIELERCSCDESLALRDELDTKHAKLVEVADKLASCRQAMGLMARNGIKTNTEQAVLDAMAGISEAALKRWIARSYTTVVRLAKAELAKREIEAARKSDAEG